MAYQEENETRPRERHQYLAANGGRNELACCRDDVVHKCNNVVQTQCNPAGTELQDRFKRAGIIFSKKTQKKHTQERLERELPHTQERTGCQRSRKIENDALCFGKWMKLVVKCAKSEKVSNMRKTGNCVSDANREWETQGYGLMRGVCKERGDF